MCTSLYSIFTLFNGVRAHFDLPWSSNLQNHSLIVFLQKSKTCTSFPFKSSRHIYSSILTFNNYDTHSSMDGTPYCWIRLVPIFWKQLCKLLEKCSGFETVETVQSVRRYHKKCEMSMFLLEWLVMFLFFSSLSFVIPKPVAWQVNWKRFLYPLRWNPYHPVSCYLRNFIPNNPLSRFLLRFRS